MSPRRLLGLFPKWWRRRYGDEFLAVLETLPSIRRWTLDIVRSAIDARMASGELDGRSSMVVRFCGLAGFVTGCALVIGLVSSWLGFSAVNDYTLPVVYVLALLGAAGIHLRQARLRPDVAWPAFGLFALGLVVGSSAVSLSLAGGGMPNSDFGLLQGIGLWLGSAALGMAMLVIGALPRVAGVAFVAGSALALVGSVAGEGSSGSLLWVGAQVGLAIYGGGWIVSGLVLQTGHHVADGVGAA